MADTRGLPTLPPPPPPPLPPRPAGAEPWKLTAAECLRISERCREIQCARVGSPEAEWLSVDLGVDYLARLASQAALCAGVEEDRDGLLAILAPACRKGESYRACAERLVRESLALPTAPAEEALPREHGAPTMGEKIILEDGGPEYQASRKRIGPIIHTALVDLSAGVTNVVEWHALLRELRLELGGRTELLLDRCDFTPAGLRSALTRIYADALASEGDPLPAAPDRE